MLCANGPWPCVPCGCCCCCCCSFTGTGSVGVATRPPPFGFFETPAGSGFAVFFRFPLVTVASPSPINSMAISSCSSSCTSSPVSLETGEVVAHASAASAADLAFAAARLASAALAASVLVLPVFSSFAFSSPSLFKRFPKRARFPPWRTRFSSSSASSRVRSAVACSSHSTAHSSASGAAPAAASSAACAAIAAADAGPKLRGWSPFSRWSAKRAACITIALPCSLSSCPLCRSCLARDRLSSTLSGETNSYASFKHGLKFRTWCGHPAGTNTASPVFCVNDQGETPVSFASFAKSRAVR
mmetsp:Transcript_13790/g.51640  ORF Transcript_13790/g.51640 Transcript_13790/m.51640 type:complete len:301 (-) Transcript_13790:3506-4408(-)